MFLEPQFHDLLNKNSIFFHSLVEISIFINIILLSMLSSLCTQDFISVLSVSEILVSYEKLLIWS